MSSFFTQKASRSKKRSVEKIDPILYSEDNPDFYIIVDRYLTNNQIKNIKNRIKILTNKNVKLCVIYPYIKKMDSLDWEKDVFKTLIYYSRSFETLIPPKSKILAIGRGLQALTKDTSITVEAFYDVTWNKQSFYHPDTQSQVFPVNYFFTWYNTDEGKFQSNWDKMFLDIQLRNIVNYSFPRLRVPLPNITRVENPNQFLLDNLGAKEVAWDLETGGFDFLSDPVVCITMSFDGVNGYYLRFKDIDLEILNRFFKDKYQIGANLKFDVKFLKTLGISNAKVDFDTLHAGHCLNEMRSNSLKTHAWIYSPYGGYDLDLEIYKLNHTKIKNRYDKIPESILFKYATMDSVSTFYVHKKMKEQLSEDPLLEKYFYEEVMTTIPMFIEMELEGAYIDWEKISNEITPKIESKIVECENKIFKEFGKKINLRSKVQLSNFIEHQLHWPCIGRGKDGRYLTNKEVLEEWVDMGYGAASYILEYSSYRTLLTTFAGHEKEIINVKSGIKELNKKKGKTTGLWLNRKVDGRIHPVYWVMLAKSHRNRSESPNFQNFPHHGEKAEWIRSYFLTPSDEYYTAGYDYSGLQLRILAILSKDPVMSQIFSEPNGDMHSMTCIGVFHQGMTLEEFLAVKNESPYDENRFASKAINFGFAFGLAAFSFYYRTLRKTWSDEQCNKYCLDNNIEIIYEDNIPNYGLTAATEFRRRFFEKYIGLELLIKNKHEEAEKNGYIRCEHGARRLTPQLLYRPVRNDDSNMKEISKLKNIAINSPVQNFESVVVHRAMRNFHEWAKENNMKSRLHNQVHDEIVYFIHKEEAPIVIPKIYEIMSKHYEEYGDILMEIEGDIADPFHKENPTYWGYGVDSDKLVENNYEYDKCFVEAK
jgi:DNA polymerase-1